MRIDRNVQTACGLNETHSKGSPARPSAVRDYSDDAVLLSSKLGVTDVQGNKTEGGDVRMEKVEALRTALLNGTYRVSPHSVAKAMFGELLAVEG